jgi:hypothetical protein
VASSNIDKDHEHRNEAILVQVDTPHDQPLHKT